MPPLLLWFALWSLGELAQRDLAPQCLADVHEPNDRRAQARRAHEVIEGILCPGDIDWFTVSLAPGRYVVALEAGAAARVAWHLPRRRRPVFGLHGVGRSRRLTVRAAGRHKVALRGGPGWYRLRISPAEAP